MAAQEIFPIQDFKIGGNGNDFRPMSDEQRAYEEEVARAGNPLGATEVAPVSLPTHQTEPTPQTSQQGPRVDLVDADKELHPSNADATTNPETNLGKPTPPALTPPSIPTSSSPPKGNQSAETKPSSSASTAPSAPPVTSTESK